MAAIAPNSDQTRALQEDTRRAWNAYSETLRDLTGEEYERTERESWTKLQTELRRLERRRQSVHQNTT